MKRCPNCGELFDTIKVKKIKEILVTERLDGTEMEYGGFLEIKKEFKTKEYTKTYYCKICNQIIDLKKTPDITLQEIEKIEQKKKEEMELILERRKENNIIKEDAPEGTFNIEEAIAQDWKGNYSGFTNTSQVKKEEKVVICKNCNSKNVIIEEELINCYNCNKKLTKKNIKETIQMRTNEQSQCYN